MQNGLFRVVLNKLGKNLESSNDPDCKVHVITLNSRYYNKKYII